MTKVKPSRRERAAATRQKIIDAATAEFTEAGYHAATVASIARRAGVATQTAYFVFHTKTAMLTAAIDAAVLNDDGPPDKTAWWAEATSTADGPRSIELFVAGTAAIFARAALLNQVAAAAASDSDVADVLTHHERLREQGYRAFIESVATRGLLQTQLTLEEATDYLLTFVGPSVYLELTLGRGWETARYIRWTTQTVSRLLLR